MTKGQRFTELLPLGGGVRYHIRAVNAEEPGTGNQSLRFLSARTYHQISNHIPPMSLHYSCCWNKTIFRGYTDVSSTSFTSTLKSVSTHRVKTHPAPTKSLLSVALEQWFLFSFFFPPHLHVFLRFKRQVHFPVMSLISLWTWANHFPPLGFSLQVRKMKETMVASQSCDGNHISYFYVKVLSWRIQTVCTPPTTGATSSNE